MPRDTLTPAPKGRKNPLERDHYPDDFLISGQVKKNKKGYGSLVLNRVSCLLFIDNFFGSSIISAGEINMKIVPRSRESNTFFALLNKAIADAIYNVIVAISKSTSTIRETYRGFCDMD